MGVTEPPDTPHPTEAGSLSATDCSTESQGQQGFTCSLRRTLRPFQNGNAMPFCCWKVASTEPQCVLSAREEDVLGSLPNATIDNASIVRWRQLAAIPAPDAPPHAKSICLL